MPRYRASRCAASSAGVPSRSPGARCASPSIAARRAGAQSCSTPPKTGGCGSSSWRPWCASRTSRRPTSATLLLDRFGPTVTVARAGREARRVPLPPVRTLQATLAAWRTGDAVKLTAMTNPDAFKSRFRLAGSNSDATVTRLNEVWQIDASPMDALCVDGRYAVYAAVDVYSRRLVLNVAGGYRPAPAAADGRDGPRGAAEHQPLGVSAGCGADRSSPWSTPPGRT